ncbi:MAG TPA: Hpt domain-containing protein, partial [Candidatus Bathyarchaeia archaeon]|nr:Hpt domain-containing protein [Candidatus Bathyarchaeia archaeon]
MSFDNDQYRQLFIDEAKEHLDTITKSMLILEKEPENQEVINMLFRAAHTLKGSSGMMGFKDFQELTHNMEDIFDDMRKGNRPSCNLITALLECLDALSQRLENIQNKVDGDIEVEQFKDKLQKAKSQLQILQPQKENESKQSALENNRLVFNENEKELISKAENAGEQCFIINFKFADDCSFKTIRASMVLDKIAEVGRIVKSVPASEEFDEQKLSQGFKMAVTSKLDEETVAKSAKSVLEVESVSISAYNTFAPPVKKTLDGLLAENNYVITVENKKIVKVFQDQAATQTVRVKFDQLDKLMNWVGELVINKIALLQITSDNRNDQLKHVTENIDRLTADLQDLVMEVRMVPVSQVFDRFPRLVRDLSLKKGKKIDLVMEGKDIEVDRTVLDEIGEPLIHLLRNSVDHGVEIPEDRVKINKNETGTIKL